MGGAQRYYKTIDGYLTNEFYDVTFSGKQIINLACNEFEDTPTEIKPINYKIKNAQLQKSKRLDAESHIVYIKTNNTFTPILIEYKVNHIGEKGVTYVTVECTDLFTGNSINYDDINTMK